MQAFVDEEPHALVRGVLSGKDFRRLGRLRRGNARMHSGATAIFFWVGESDSLPESPRLSRLGQAYPPPGGTRRQKDVLWLDIAPYFEM